MLLAPPSRPLVASFQQVVPSPARLDVALTTMLASLARARAREGIVHHRRWSGNRTLRDGGHVVELGDGREEGEVVSPRLGREPMFIRHHQGARAGRSVERGRWETGVLSTSSGSGIPSDSCSLRRGKGAHLVLRASGRVEVEAQGRRASGRR